MSRTYSELIKLKTYEERYRYLQLNGKVGAITFGYDRYINQMLYHSQEWRNIRDKVIIRDNGCDLGIEGREINDKIYIHHIEPIAIEDILNRHSKVFDPDNLICVSFGTHQAIHYGNESLLIKDPVGRTKNDTCPWRHD